MYMLTAKLAYGLHHDATVLDYNLNLKYLIIWDVKYPAHARLWKIEKSKHYGNTEHAQTSIAHM